MPPRKPTQHVKEVYLGRPDTEHVLSALDAINANGEDEDQFGSELSESVAKLVYTRSCETNLEPPAFTPFVKRPSSAGSSMPVPETFRMAARQDKKGVMTRTMPALPSKGLEAEHIQPASSQHDSEPRGSEGRKIVSSQELDHSNGYDAPQEQQRERNVKIPEHERAESTRRYTEEPFSIMPITPQQRKHSQDIIRSEDDCDTSRNSALTRLPSRVPTRQNLLPQAAGQEKLSSVVDDDTSAMQPEHEDPVRTDETQTVSQKPEHALMTCNEARRSESPPTEHERAEALQLVNPSHHATVDLTKRTPDPPQVSRPPVRALPPSEEDLFYLLMHRQRRRKTIENHLRGNQKKLEAGNAQLYQQNRRLNRDLEAARVCHGKHIAELKVRQDVITDFKARFSKLKDHVKEISKQQATLAEGASVIRQRAQALAVDKTTLQQDLELLRAGSTSSVESIQGLSSKLSDLCACVAPLEASLATAKQVAEVRAQHLSLEEHRNKRLETFVVQLSTTQNRYSSEIQDEQKRMFEQLRRLNKKVDAVQDVMSQEPPPLQLPVLDECVKMLKDVHGAEHIGPDELSKVTEKVALLADSFAIYQESSLGAIEAVKDGNLTTSSKVESKLGALLESLKATTVQQENLIDLHEKGIRLEEKLKSSGDIMEVIRDGRNSAEAREQHLRTTTDNLIAELKDIRDRLTSKATCRPTNELEMITTWQIKYLDVSGRLAARDQSLAAKEKEIETQDRDIKGLHKRVQDVEAERDSAVNSAHEAENSSITASNALGDLNVKLANAEAKLVHSRTETETAGDERVAQARTAHAEEFSSLRSEASWYRQELGDAQKQIEQLNGDLKDLALLHDQVKEASQLKSQIATQEMTINELKEKQGALDNTNRLLKQAELERSQQAQELKELRPQVKVCRNALDRVKALDQDLGKKTEEIERLSTKSKEIDHLNMCLEVKDTEMNKLRSNLEKVHIDLKSNQKLADQVPLLRERLEQTAQRTDSLAKELEDSRKEVESAKLREQSLKSTAADVETVLAQLSKTQGIADKVPNLEQRLQEAEATASTAQQELGIAAKAADHLLEVEALNEQKDQVVIKLLNRARNAESSAREVQELRKESLGKDAEIQTLKRDLKEAQESPPLGSVDVPQTTVSKVAVPSQDTMRALQELSTPEIPESLEIATKLVRPSSQANQPRQRADRTGTSDVGASTVAHLDMVPIEKHVRPRIQVAKERTQDDHPAATHASTTWNVSLTQETSCIPEPQQTVQNRACHTEAKGTPAADIESSLSSEASSFEELIRDQEDRSVYFNTVRPSDLLRNVSKTTPEHTAKEPGRQTSSKKRPEIPVNLAHSATSQRASQADSPSNRPPSSSYGGSMLLEQVEQIQDDGVVESDSQKRHYVKNSKTTENARLREDNTGYATNVAFQDPSPRRLRSESQTRRRESVALSERSSSELNTPARLPGILKETHRPNSAAKRRQEIEETSEVDSSQKSTKRLKRNHSAVEIKRSTSKLGGPPTSASKTRLNRPSIPTGSRMSSVIGTTSPAPGNAQQRAKKAKKKSKNDRFAAQFNKATD